MKVIWSIIAESSAVDRETNRVSLFNILEEAHLLDPPDRSDDPDIVPAVPAKYVVVTLFGRTTADEAETRQARLVVAMPDGKVVESDPLINVDLETARRHRSVVNLTAIPLGGQGEYRFLIQEPDENGGWRSMFEVPLHIDYLSQ